MLSASRGLAPHKGLDSMLMKMGRTGLLAQPRRGPQAGKSGDPRSQNADNCHISLHDHVVDIVFVAKPPCILFIHVTLDSLPSRYTARGIHIGSYFVLVSSCNH